MKRSLLWFIPGMIVGILLILGGSKVLRITSANEYCISCHIHPVADAACKKSVHYETQSGYRVACVECHLPPKGDNYLWAKGTTGLRDLWSMWTRDSSSFNWEDRRRLEVAREYVYESSCIKCHENLFPADPKKLQRRGLISRFFKNDTSVINTYVTYKDNSPSRTQTADKVKPNPFGLKNMLGNVAEFCSDWYQQDILASYTDDIIKDPKGPESGLEHVVRGGSFLEMAGSLRSGSRDYTREDDWLKTDPQIPKSIWWYSDCFSVGFRVVCEFDNKTGNL